MNQRPQWPSCLRRASGRFRSEPAVGMTAVCISRTATVDRQYPFTQAAKKPPLRYSSPSRRWAYRTGAIGQLWSLLCSSFRAFQRQHGRGEQTFRAWHQRPWEWTWRVANWLAIAANSRFLRVSRAFGPSGNVVGSAGLSQFLAMRIGPMSAGRSSRGERRASWVEVEQLRE